MLKELSSVLEEFNADIIFSNDFFAFKNKYHLATFSDIVGAKKGSFSCYLSVISQVFGYRRNKFRQVFFYERMLPKN